MSLYVWLAQSSSQTDCVEQQPKHPIETLIIKMLVRIDQAFFKGLEVDTYYDKQKSFYTILHQIQRYLIRKQCKKFNKEYFRCLGQTGNDQDLIAIVFYLSVNSQISDQIVGNIFEFSSGDQQYLMQRYKQVEYNLEKIVQLKQVIQKIEAIQLDNNRLKDYYLSKEAELECHIQQICELKAYNKQIRSQNERYSREKQGALKELQLVEMQEFKQLCLFHSQHNAQATDFIERSNQEKQRLMERNIQLKRQLNCYGATIRCQIDELQRLKSWYSIYQQQSLLKSQQTYPHPLSDIALPLSDNKNILNISGYSNSQAKALLSDRTYCSSHGQRQDQTLLKNNLGSLLELNRLQEEELKLYAKIDQLGREVSCQTERRRRLDGKISRMKKVQEQHVSAYFNVATSV